MKLVPTKEVEINLTFEEFQYLCDYISDPDMSWFNDNGRFYKLLLHSTSSIIQKLAIQLTKRKSYTVKLTDGKAEALLAFCLITPPGDDLVLYNAIISQLDKKF